MHAGYLINLNNKVDWKAHRVNAMGLYSFQAIPTHAPCSSPVCGSCPLL